MEDHALAKVFTTGQVAEICQVAPRTVSKWFDSGRLRGYRIPGSRDRRIPRECLQAFLRENGMPLGKLQDTGILRVLVIASDQRAAESIAMSLKPEGFDLRVAASAFEAGTLAVVFRPHAVIVDSSAGNVTLTGIATLLKRDPSSECSLIAIEPRGQELPESVAHLFDDCFHLPFDPALLSARIQSKAVAGRKPPRKG
jgi:excisionase family DNA binding protein